MTERRELWTPVRRGPVPMMEMVINREEVRP